MGGTWSGDSTRACKAYGGLAGVARGDRTAEATRTDQARRKAGKGIGGVWSGYGIGIWKEGGGSKAEGRAYCLHVVLVKREYVLQWVQFSVCSFLYAEGTGDSVRAVFTTHDVEFRAED